MILFHLPDPVSVLRHHAAALRPKGLLLALDFDIGASRAEPALPLADEALADEALADEALGWVNAAFRHAGASPAIGTRLALLLAEAGLAGVQGFGVQGYIAPGDQAGPALLCGVVRTLAPQIVAAGLATPKQIGIDTLEARLIEVVRASGVVILPPTLAGA